jgi:hypothetical protein
MRGACPRTSRSNEVRSNSVCRFCDGTGTLADLGGLFIPAENSLPRDMDRDRLRLGMPGTATVFAENAGVIGLLMSILVWVSSYTAYL